jgi:hypothetical protein
VPNISAPKARAEIKPRHNLRVDFGYSWFWLASDKDRFNGANNARDVTGRSGGFVGQEFDIRVRYAWSPKTEIILIRADGSVSLFEWTMRSVLARRVEARFGALADRPGNATLRMRQKEAWILLSALAWAGDAARARQAAARGLDHLQLPIQDPAPGAQCTLDAGDASLERLAELRDTDRHRVVEAAAATVAEDALMQPQELLLLRAVADRLNVLIPSSIELLEQDAPGALLDP